MNEGEDLMGVYTWKDGDVAHIQFEDIFGDTYEMTVSVKDLPQLINNLQKLTEE